ncbi:MAG: sugar isomerase domain-containing protein [Nitriliruptoraceae bacterium]
MTPSDRPPAAASYLEALVGHLELLHRRSSSTIEEVATRAAASIRDGGVVHVFGCGHSQLVALEASDRAGGLAAIHAIVDPALAPTGGVRSARTERLPGYGQVVLETEDLRSGELLIVVSNSGINPVPIDVARGAAELGLFVVAVTSREHSDAVISRHPSGLRLHEVAHVTLDTGVPTGDAALHLDDGTVVGPLSTVLASAAMHALVAAAAAQLAATGDEVPVLVSQNLDGPADPNEAVVARYADRKRGRP